MDFADADCGDGGDIWPTGTPSPRASIHIILVQVVVTYLTFTEATTTVLRAWSS